MSSTLQYTLVGIILLAACAWIIWKIAKGNKKSGNSCCGCGLAETCEKRNLKKKRG